MSPFTDGQALEAFVIPDSKTAIVVGATKGIGGSTARRLAQHGCSRVIIFGRSEERGTELVRRMKKISPNPDKLEGLFVARDLT